MNRYINFFKLSQKLKFVKRAGWTRFKEIDDVESVSDHCWMASLICLSLPVNLNINKDRCLKIALLHDLAEVLCGDITPHDNVPKAYKKTMEDIAFREVIDSLDEQIKNELYEIFNEYENGQSIEAQIVRDVDKYEMMLMAYQYEMKYQHVDLSEFFSCAHVIQTEPIKELLQSLMDERKSFLEVRNKQ